MPKAVIFDVDGALLVLCGDFGENGLKDACCMAIYPDPADLPALYDRSPLAKEPFPSSSSPWCPW